MAIVTADQEYLLNRMNATAFWAQLGTLLRNLENAAGSPNVVLTDVPCNAAVAVGDWVRLDGTSTCQKAIADSEANSNVLGVVEEKASAVLCTVRVLGVSSGIFAGLDVAQEYFLSASTAGAMTTTPPSASGEILLKLGQPFSATEFLVLKGMRIERT